MSSQGQQPSQAVKASNAKSRKNKFHPDYKGKSDTSSLAKNKISRILGAGSLDPANKMKKKKKKMILSSSADESLHLPQKKQKIKHDNINNQEQEKEQEQPIPTHTYKIIKGTVVTTETTKAKPFIPKAKPSATGSMLQLMIDSNPNPTSLGPYTNRMKILLVGEGDFSFSLALASKLGGKNLVCTSYDTKRQLIDKYPESAQGTVTALEAAGAIVMHGVDATALEKHFDPETESFHRIVFNFPHLGGSDDDSIASNKELIRKFLRSSGPFLRESEPVGEVHISLRTKSAFYRYVLILFVKS